MINKFGVMQGRLSKPLNGKIQSFPKKTWEKEFSLAKKLSLKYIEWTLDQKDLYKNPLLNEEGRNKINKLCKKNNIKVISITGDCFMQKPFWKEKKNLKKKLLIDLKNIISSASKMNIKYLILPLVDNGSIKNNFQENTIYIELKKLIPILKKNKLKILFETDFNPTKYFNFIKKFKKNFFGINYDIGNSASYNFDPIAEFKKYGKYIKNIHAKDRKKFGNTVPLGKGNSNFKLIFNLCRKYKYKGSFTVQAAREKSGAELKTISKYLTYLKKQF